MAGRVLGYIASWLKYLVVFILALAVPMIIADGGTVLALWLVTLYIAAWYGKRELPHF